MRLNSSSVLNADREGDLPIIPEIYLIGHENSDSPKRKIFSIEYSDVIFIIYYWEFFLKTNSR